MRKASKFSVLVIGLLFLVATLFAPSLPAQTATTSRTASVQPDAIKSAVDDDSDKADSDEAAFTSFSIGVRLAESGHTWVNASLFAPKGQSPSRGALKSALESALSCELVDNAPARQMVGKTQSFYFGSCELRPQGSSLFHQGSVLMAPLVDIARQNKVQKLQIEFFLPLSGQSEMSPLPNENSQIGLHASTRRIPQMFLYAWKVDEPIPSSLSFRFGYQAAKLKRSAIVLFLLLLAPLALVAWLSRKALSADVPDKAVVWFSYMRSLSWILNGSLLVWWAALDYFQVPQVLRFAAAGTPFSSLMDHPAARQGLGWIPPSIIWLLCYRLSHPVQERLRGLNWTKRELTLQALYSTLAGLIPFAMFLTGINLLTSDSSAAAMWIIAGAIIRGFAAKALLKLTGMQPHALSTGPLRDRAFAMAEQLDVKLQQVYLIPSGKGQMANAFASSANNISFTDFLLQRMSEREVDYVMAHELTHLKLNHPRKLGMARITGFFLGLFALTTISILLPAPNLLLLHYLFMFGVMTIFPFFISRRFEYAADAGAVGLTKDPQAAISALFKLSQLNMLPNQWNQWSEKWLSHPSTLRRAQAVAKAAGIALEEIPSIALAGTADGATYSRQVVTPPAKLHSTEHKKASLQKLSYILLAILSFVPCFFSLAAKHFYANHVLSLSLFAAAIPVTFGAVLLFSNYIPRLTRGDIARRLDEKLTAQAIQVKAWGGVYVGLSPSAAPRSYEGNSFWDVGYLFFRSDRICYWGEEVQFALVREQITAIKLAMGLPGYLGAKKIYISWKDEERGTCGVFNLGCGHTDSVLNGVPQTAALAKRLQIWWKDSSPARPLPAPLDTLASPVPRAVTSAIPGALWKPGKLFNELFATAWIAALAALLCGLPFHLMAYLTSSAYTKLGLPAITSPGAGWFVVFAAASVRFLSLIPAIRYRDKPILVAQPPAKAGSGTSSSGGQRGLRAGSSDPVSVA